VDAVSVEVLSLCFLSRWFRRRQRSTKVNQVWWYRWQWRSAKV